MVAIVRTIIAGSRSITDYDDLLSAMTQLDWEITEVVSGTADGVDQLGERWAKARDIPIAKFPAQWNRYGRGAGYKRNEEMAQFADALLAVYDGTSKGTQHMIDIARERKLKVKVVLILKD
jgi:hypothetical protein